MNVWYFVYQGVLYYPGFGGQDFSGMYRSADHAHAVARKLVAEPGDIQTWACVVGYNMEQRSRIAGSYRLYLSHPDDEEDDDADW